MELQRTKKYCFALGSDELLGQQLVGGKSINLSRLQKLNLNIPPGFVLSGQAFDDFLLATNLVDPLVEQLGRATEVGSAQIPSVAQAIRELILAAKIPQIIANDVIKAYQGLSAFSEALVAVRQSALTEQLSEVNYDRASTGYLNIKGTQNLLTAVKQVWADLFSAEAIRYRLQTEYEGNLTQPVLIQRMISADSSGLIYNFDLSTHSINNLSVIANLGISDSNNLALLNVSSNAGHANSEKLDLGQSDYYLIAKQSQSTIAGLKRPQKFMWVKPSRDSSASYVQVKVSTLWTDKQKLDEFQLRKLTNYMRSIEQTFPGFIELEWVQETDQLYFTSLRLLAEPDLKFFPEFSWGSADTSADTSAGAVLPVISPIIPVATEINLEKEQILELLQKTEDELVLTDIDRDTKAHSVTQMLPEVKTATEVWSNSLLSASELKVFKSNLDGIGLFRISEVARTYEPNFDLSNLANAHALQKKICEHLALYLIAMQPKPLLIQIEKNLDFETQLQIFSKLRNLYGHKNFWVVLPELLQLEEVSSYKKELTASGFRRTNAFQVFQLISQPLHLHNMAALAELSIDGIVLDADLLLSHLLGMNPQFAGSSGALLDFTNLPAGVVDSFSNYLVSMLKPKNKLHLPTLFYSRYSQLLQALLPQILKVGINGVFYGEQGIYEFKLSLAEEENQVLTNGLKKIKKSANL